MSAVVSRVARFVLVGLGYLALAAVLGFVLATVLTRGQDDERDVLIARIAELEEINRQQVAAHRVANQSDHDRQSACLLALVALLTDPDRDRLQSLPTPRECQR